MRRNQRRGAAINEFGPLACEVLEQRRLLTNLVSGDRYATEVTTAQPAVYSMLVNEGDHYRLTFELVNSVGIRARVSVAQPGQDFPGGSLHTRGVKSGRAEATGILRVRFEATGEHSGYRVEGRAAIIPAGAEYSGAVDENLPNGQSFSGSVSQGDFQILQFAASDGSNIYGSIVDPDLDTIDSPGVTVYSPSGEVLMGANATNHFGQALGGFNTRVAPESGRYTAIVSGTVYAAADFRIQVVVASPGESPAARRDAFYGSTNKALSLARGELGLVTFQAVAGDSVKLTSYHSGDERTRFVPELLAPSGSGAGANSFGEFEATETGTYSALLRDSDAAMEAVIELRVNANPSRRGDVDGDGDFDANDSFLMHLVQLAGSDIQIGANQGSSPIDRRFIRNRINDLAAAADIDGDGDFDANDSFLVHLVRLSGSNEQIEQFKGASPLTVTEIRQRVNDLFPAGQQSTGDIAFVASSGPLQLFDDEELDAVWASTNRPLGFSTAQPDRETTFMNSQTSAQKWKRVVSGS